jgi:hypothetical protein
MIQTIPTISKASIEDALDQITQDDVKQFVEDQPNVVSFFKEVPDAEQIIGSFAVLWFAAKKQMELDAQS